MPLPLDVTVPEGYVFWTPGRNDLSDDGEGFGPFRDTWQIPRFRVRAAQDVVREEARLVAAVASIANNETEFDLLARALEGKDEEPLPVALATAAAGASLEADLEEARLEDLSPLESLDMGVAGLVFALNAVGCWTAASCRGHPGERAWSPRPIVYLAADAHRVRALQPVVEQTRCGFAEGGLLLGIEAESIEDTMALARAVIQRRRQFLPPRAPRQAKPAKSPVSPNQATLGL